MKRGIGCVVLGFVLVVNIAMAHQLQQNRRTRAETPAVAAREIPFVSAQMYEIPMGWACEQCISKRTYALLFYDPAAERPLQQDECRAFVWQAVREGEYVLLEAHTGPGLTGAVVALDGGRAEERVLVSMNQEQIASVEIREEGAASVLEVDPERPVVKILPSDAYVDFYDVQGRFLHGVLPKTGQNEDKTE